VSAKNDGTSVTVEGPTRNEPAVEARNERGNKLLDVVGTRLFTSFVIGRFLNPLKVKSKSKSKGKRKRKRKGGVSEVGTLLGQAGRGGLGKP